MSKESVSALTRCRRMLGFNSADTWNYVLAALGGALCPVIAGQLLSTELLDALGPEQTIYSKFSYVFFVAFYIPFLEEVLFRGIIWRVLETLKLRPITIVLYVSLAFALAHGEPEHIVGVLPITFYLGWLRERSNSILPTILCHGINNLVIAISIIITLMGI